MNEFKKEKPYRYKTGTNSNMIYFPFVLIIIILYIIYLIIVTPSNMDLIPILNGPGLQDFLVLLIFIPLLSILLLFFIPFFSLGFYKLYTLIFRNSREYYLDMNIQLDKWTSRDTIKRAFHPGLMICALAQFIVTATGTGIWFIGVSDIAIIFAMFNASFIIFPMVLILYMPLWLLFDSGVMSRTNPDYLGKKRTPETVETIEKYFSSKWKGFGGLAFVINFISMIVQAALLTISPLVSIFLFLVPFIGISLLIPVQTLYEKLLPYLTKQVHKYSNLHSSRLSLVSVDDCPACNSKMWK